MAEKAAQKSKISWSKRKEMALWLMMLVAFIVFGLVIWIKAPSPETIAQFGFVGVFLAALVSSASIFFPGPGMLVAFIAGGFLNPVLVGIASGFGAGIGELAGYWVGRQGEFMVENVKGYKKMRMWMERYGGWLIFLGAAIPNPIFDAIGIAAGATEYPVKRFLIATIMGKTLRGLIMAFAGAQSWEWLVHFFK